jgi:hypothetical protein
VRWPAGIGEAIPAGILSIKWAADKGFFLNGNLKEAGFNFIRDSG